MSYPPARFFTGGLVAGAGAVLLLILLVLIPMTRRERSSMAPAAPSARATGFGAAVAVVAVVVVGGWIGLVAVAIGLASLRLSRDGARAALVVALPVVLGMAEIVAPWPESLGLPVELSRASALGWLAAVSIVAVGGLGTRWRPSGTHGPAQREQGSFEHVPRG